MVFFWSTSCQVASWESRRKRHEKLQRPSGSNALMSRPSAGWQRLDKITNSEKWYFWSEEIIFACSSVSVLVQFVFSILISQTSLLDINFQLFWLNHLPFRPFSVSWCFKTQASKCWLRSRIQLTKATNLHSVEYSPPR